MSLPSGNSCNLYQRFGSGLAIVPFLQQGVVQQFGWLNEHQFLDAVAVAMITPGPVVITVAFSITNATIAQATVIRSVYLDDEGSIDPQLIVVLGASVVEPRLHLDLELHRPADHDHAPDQPVAVQPRHVHQGQPESFDGLLGQGRLQQAEDLVVAGGVRLRR